MFFMKISVKRFTVKSKFLDDGDPLQFLDNIDKKDGFIFIKSL